MTAYLYRTRKFCVIQKKIGIKVLKKTCLYLLFCLPFLSFAQTPIEMEKNADVFFQQKKYTNAVDLYEQIIAIDNNNFKAVYKAGICYLELGVIENAIEYLETVKIRKDSTIKDFNFWYAKAAYYNQEFDTALYYLKRTSLTYGKDAKILVDNITNAAALQKEKKDYVIENLGENINTSLSEIAPLLSRDKKTMIFTRNKHNPKLHEDGKNIIEHEIVESSFKNDNLWTKPKTLTGFSDTSLIANQFTDDDQKIFFQKDGNLYLSEFVGNSWKIPAPIEGYLNSNEFIEKNCFVYNYGQKMILISNRGTKNGNFDLFESSLRRDGIWSLPQPIENLNSLEDEISPFISDDEKTLYFSSKGHKNIGGYDIFKAVLDEKTQTWGKPENIGMPINSVNDDYYFSLYDDIGYFTSQRMGGFGSDDLYKVYFFSKIKVTGKVFNRITNQATPNSKIRFITETNIFEVVTDENGAYEILLPFIEPIQIKVFLEGKVVYEERLQIYLQPKKNRSLNRNYYIDLSNESKGNNKKSPEINDTLQEIHIFGIVNDFKTGQRFIQPIQLLDSLGKELKGTSTDQNGHYTINTMLNNERYALYLHKKGYLMTFKDVRIEDIVNQKLEINIEMLKIETGAKFILRNVYFNSGSDVLASTSFSELNKLYFFLKENPETKIEIGGHTDNIGNEVSNLKLSTNRANSVLLYLTNKGIGRNRLISKGYGDTQPLASNDDEKDGRELNRRIEIIILPSK